MDIQENHRNFRVPIKQIRIKLVEYDERIKRLEAALEKLGIGTLPVEPVKDKPVKVEAAKKRSYNKKEI